MNKMIVNSFLLSVSMVLTLACSSCDKNEGSGDKALQTVKYEISNELFPNPERGFYRHLGGNPGTLSSVTMKGFRAGNISLVLKVFYLRDFRTSPISDAMLANIEKDMNAMRDAGMKCVIRFAYCDNELEGELDPSLNTIIGHLDQLKPILQKHEDVIATMQAGFIGAWGEWYYTTSELKTQAAKSKIIAKLLEVLPPNRTVQLRTPAYKKNYIGKATPLAASEAYAATSIARLGHHNDCFLASENDYGTYENVAEDKNYLNKEGLYLPVGGETCPPSGIDPADCDKAQNEMRYLRWSYLNQDYYKGVNDGWIAQGCMDNIVACLGYRFALTEASFSNAHSKGSSLKGVVKLTNLGYAAPYNKRNVELVLVSAIDETTYVVQLPDDPRTWKPNQNVELTFDVALPQDIPDGYYHLCLALPDPMPSLHDRPEYSIRLANKGVWLADKGYNDLDYSVVVDNSSMQPSSTSSLSFVKK